MLLDLKETLILNKLTIFLVQWFNLNHRYIINMRMLINIPTVFTGEANIVLT